MSNLSRWIPNSVPTRTTVINKAFEVHSATPVANQIFTNRTATRLLAIQPLWKTANDTVAEKGALYAAAVDAKNATLWQLQKHDSHFLQVFILGTERLKYPKGHLAFYNLDVENPRLPDLRSDDGVKTVAQRIVDGDAQRMLLAGALAMANPSAAEVGTLLTTFLAQDTAASQALLELNTARQQREALLTELDAVILKVYDETEAFYNELPDESQRESSREWGVMYITIGEETQVTALVKDAGGNPVANQEVKLGETGKKVTTGADGKALFITRVVGPARFVVLDALGEEMEYPFTITEGIAMTVEIVLP